MRTVQMKSDYTANLALVETQEERNAAVIGKHFYTIPNRAPWQKPSLIDRIRRFLGGLR